MGFLRLPLHASTGMASADCFPMTEASLPRQTDGHGSMHTLFQAHASLIVVTFIRQVVLWAMPASIAVEVVRVCLIAKVHL